ncbi:MAG: hypothetical protein GKR90_17090 [Pseudomonadales bacterium]|nr:hypothetical protein [Pseudomonadales bacterium]
MLRHVLVIFVALVAWSSAYGLDPRGDIEKAVELMEARQYSFARSYLEPSLISPYISSGERSRAYYLRGFSFLAENMPVSARKDFNRALEFNPVNPAALVELGRLHMAGKGIEKDADLAVALFQQAADLDYPPGHFHIGYAYLLGEGVEKNLLKAREILGMAADEGHGFAMMSLAASYRKEHVSLPDPELAIEWYEKAYDAGESKALLSIGYMWANGEVGEPDTEQALAAFRKAAEAGVIEAHTSLAYAYLTGAGVEENPGAAFDHYSEAAAGGDVAAFLGLGHLYEHGIGVEQSAGVAKTWYERSARLGNVDAQLRMVGIYLKEGSAIARRQAIYWGREAASSGIAQALNDYAWLLATSKFEGDRNGILALDQAKKAVDSAQNAAYLDTLAAAYAEVGNFAEAIAVQEQALKAITDDEADLRGELQERLEYYQRSQPWRE